MSNSLEPTPQERLAVSRRAILRHMNAGEDTHAAKPDQTRYDDPADDPADRQRTGSTRSVWQMFRRAVNVWLNNHPAQLAVDVARPVLGKYAQEKPLQLLGVAAVIGAAFVLVKPWRLVSLTGLAIAAIKSSNASGLLLSLLSARSEQPSQENHN